MKIQCDWCGNWINDYDEVCPSCLGVNRHYNRQSDSVPKTIEELKAWAQAKNLPLADMRTYIGEDFRGAKAFGIYKDEATGTFVVYKNKADGSRVVRYQGSDEAYAVNELYQKMKERVVDQKSHQAAAPHRTPQKSAPTGKKGSGPRDTLSIPAIVITVLIVILVGFLTIKFDSHPSTGYYTYDNNTYYYYSGNWYEWQNNSWEEATTSSWMEDNYSDYYDSSSYDSDASYDDFKDSSYYDENSNSDDSWDSDWDSDWGSDDSWDNSWDDWDSDW